MAASDTTADWWTTSDVAAYLGVRVGTVSSYRQRGQMPPPDQTLGRTQLWRPQTIVAWHTARPRVGDDVRRASDVAEPGDSEDGSLWRVFGERTIYDSEWVQLSLVDVQLPDGDRFEHHVVTMRPAAMTAVLDDLGKKVLLMWRHRFAPNLWNWELPGGLIEDGEDPVVTAAREVEEETGYRPRPLEHVVTFEPMVGMVRCPHHVYVARGAEQIGEPTETTEMQRMEWIPLDDVQGLIAQGKIANSGTLVALLHLLASRQTD